ncbi:MAG: tRNA (N(6)-L-threonylcarbamoyladenosine(37)-C(2))-methylthiotransferase MtaB [Prevotella sp.]|nr:tRNA (N(6)-L-threonylcarbamoyladenosine(37)-C(2))-methylthiotransferase MtaB [Prevotella sp.]
MINTSAFQGKKAAYFTLGCKLNFSETSTFAAMLREMGVTAVEKGEQADICLINTCSVTEVADHKCRQAIHRMVRQHPGAFVVVTGCYAQLSPQQVSEIDGVDLVLGSNEKATLIEHLSQVWTGVPKTDSLHQYHTVKTKDIKAFAPSCSRGNRTRYFLKVQDGCDYFCTYCTIPYARGFSRSATVDTLVKQARQAALEGGREIVLTGVNIGDFGKNTGENFLDLVRALDQVEGIQRYRISSLEPDLLSDELIAYCAASRAFMPHFHIPLQSGSDEVLRLMHRRYNRALFADKIQRIKEAMPDAFIGVDVIVGMRGETEAHFQETYDFLSALDITQLHVFPYSERPGTAALRIDHVVSDAEKKRRSAALLKLSDEKTRAFYERHIGTTAEVLFERATRGRAMKGFTRNYIRVELPPNEADPQLDNTICKVSLENLISSTSPRGEGNGYLAVRGKVISHLSPLTPYL